jgi:hypothetical protein
VRLTEKKRGVAAAAKRAERKKSGILRDFHPIASKFYEKTVAFCAERGYNRK